MCTMARAAAVPGRVAVQRLGVFTPGACWIHASIAAADPPICCTILGRTAQTNVKVHRLRKGRRKRQIEISPCSYRWYKASISSTYVTDYNERYFRHTTRKAIKFNRRYRPMTLCVLLFGTTHCSDTRQRCAWNISHSGISSPSTNRPSLARGAGRPIACSGPGALACGPAGKLSWYSYSLGPSSHGNSNASGSPVFLPALRAAAGTFGGPCASDG
jgi:hypothetical protein